MPGVSIVWPHIVSGEASCGEEEISYEHSARTADAQQAKGALVHIININNMVEPFSNRNFHRVIKLSWRVHQVSTDMTKSYKRNRTGGAACAVPAKRVVGAKPQPACRRTCKGWKPPAGVSEGAEL